MARYVAVQIVGAGTVEVTLVCREAGSCMLSCVPQDRDGGGAAELTVDSTPITADKVRQGTSACSHGLVGLCVERAKSRN